MSEFVALTVNDASLLECAVGQYSEQLDLHTGDSGNWGLAYYSKGELLQRIQPFDSGEVADARGVMAGLSADVIVMHTRRATVGDVGRENTHPFRFNGWTFAHNGTVHGFDKVRDQIRAAMPPFILRGIKGDTDSEHLFHLFMSFLYDTGLLGKPDLGVEKIRNALERAFITVDEFVRENGIEPSPGSTVISDGYSMVVLSSGIPVDYALVEGIRSCETCRSSVADSEQSGTDHEELRAVVVRSGNRPEPPKGFQRLEANSFLMVTKTHGIEFSPFNR